MTIVHDHGIHEYPVRFCPCLDPETDEPVPEPIQLIHFGLWPGTWKRPESAYTISGLRDHQLLGLQAQMSTHDYFEYLRRTTDMVCPEDVPDRYRELMTAAREFMFTRATKRADVEPTQELEPGVLAIRCPACPQPGINMDPKYEKTGRPEGDEYLDGLHYTIDGNFQQTQKNKPMDEADEPLTLGAAYHADERDFKEFQRTRPKEKKEPTTCHKFGAMGYSRYGGRVTGTVGLSCARHMFTLPLGSVDLNGPEAFCYADWVQLTALRPYWKTLRWLAVGYDINCQYRIHFHERIRELQKRYGHLKSIPADDFVFELLSAVGKFHLPAHIQACRFKFSYYYLRGVGMTDGEALERIWSILNSLAARTKEMTPGHRHDVLNDFLGDMNVRKLHSIARTLADRYEKARRQLATMEETMQKLEENFTVDEIVAMQAEEAQWLADVRDLDKHKKLKNPYEVKEDKVPTTKELLAEIAQARSVEHEGSDAALSVLHVVFEGVELQSLREDLLDVIEENDESEEGQKTSDQIRLDFLSRLAEWTPAFNSVIQPVLDAAAKEVMSEYKGSTSLPDTFPLRGKEHLQPNLKSKDERAKRGLPPLRDQNAKSAKSALWREIESVVVPLPSSFHELILQRPSMKTLVNWEIKVREGQAADALNDLRTGLIASATLKLAKIDMTGKRPTLRVGKKIHRKNNEVAAAAEEYRRAWVALEALGMTADEDEEGTTKSAAKGKLDAPEQDRSVSDSQEHTVASTEMGPSTSRRYRRLRKRDAVPFIMHDARESMNRSKQTVSWIWEDFGFAYKQNDPKYQAFLEDVKRVHWFRCSAMLARWREEVRLLGEETRRTVRYFGWFRGKWSRRARVHESSGKRDAAATAAYARKQAHRYVRLLDKCRRSYTAAGVGIETELWEAATRDDNEVDMVD
ncbi:hypothetical protein DICSQDRAFT_150671 [Dichomitus squalens LYAD-421 SS1]|uniref:CxC2-like cysteine cluster KDZ transposase-associated domain-containing protein n=1 Tax=Dichomitus squalens (strain LYAD-421) TaxID=732165 RepID=R7SLP9_DICSQ|nr:uncharacterized protein DICSQDRAFT_150671 [Dichomitus squalens LYAD-421 SS1]EJF55967.1 hypothetical protein DICSQDRAFT_150671 [Dichomitus squalens LYAD-421 SS1]